MSATADDLTVDYSEGGVRLVQELDKVVLSRGAWTTVVFKYREWEARRGDYGPVRFSVRRYQKRNDRYQPRSKFTISSADQARKLIAGARPVGRGRGSGGRLTGAGVERPPQWRANTPAGLATSPHISPTFVAYSKNSVNFSRWSLTRKTLRVFRGWASRCRCDKAHGPKERLRAGEAA